MYGILFFETDRMIKKIKITHVLMFKINFFIIFDLFL